MKLTTATDPSLLRLEPTSENDQRILDAMRPVYLDVYYGMSDDETVPPGHSVPIRTAKLDIERSEIKLGRVRLESVQIRNLQPVLCSERGGRVGWYYELQQEGSDYWYPMTTWDPQILSVTSLRQTIAGHWQRQDTPETDPRFMLDFEDAAEPEPTPEERAAKRRRLYPDWAIPRERPHEQTHRHNR